VFELPLAGVTAVLVVEDEAQLRATVADAVTRQLELADQRRPRGMLW
jgi:hypothetical protein